MTPSERWAMFAAAVLARGGAAPSTPKDAAAIADKMEQEFAQRWEQTTSRGYVRKPTEPK